MKSDSLNLVMDRCLHLLVLVSGRHGLAAADRQELEQDVRIRLWRALGTGDRLEAIPASYVYRAAVSAALDLARRRDVNGVVPWVEQRYSRELPVCPSSHSDEPWQRLERAELSDEISRAVNDRKLMPPEVEMPPRTRKSATRALLRRTRGDRLHLLRWQSVDLHYTVN